MDNKLKSFAQSEELQAQRDSRELERFGYAQELLRSMGGFSTFAISFTIISIITGVFTLYDYGLQMGGPLEMTLGWPLVSLGTLFVGLSMAELCSAIPTSGGTYHWSAELGGPTWAWFTAWFNIVGLVTETAGIDYGCAIYLVPVLGLGSSHSVLLITYGLILLSHAFINHYGIRWVARLSDLSVAVHILGVVVLVGALFIFVPKRPLSFLLNHQTSSPVHGPYFWLFMLGMLQAQWTYTGYDGPAQVSEETVNPRHRAPWGIVMGVVVSAIFGYILVLGLTWAIPSLSGVLNFHLKEALKMQGQPVNWKAADFSFEDAINDLVHKNILEKERRPDGRRLDELRPLDAEVGLFSRTHGSALFRRGNTQALAVTTLAAPGAEQLIETMETNGKRRFMLHYNFPPFSVGEIGNFRGPGRREIGHGNLARKSLERLIPTKEEFPYTIRVVSEIMSSNGSSSQATVCAAALSMMDAGVPLKKPAAGIAMGLMMKREMGDGGQGTIYKVLTDIQGPEDHHGDMDLKVAGTVDGVTGMQMDVKVDGLTIDILEKAFEQTRKARLEILKVLTMTLPAPRKELSPFVPAIKQLKIPVEKIGLLIGPGGKTINGLVEKYMLAGIDVEEDGGVFVSGTDRVKVEAAAAEIAGLTHEFKAGDIVEGNVVKTLEFGAIVDLGSGKDGMIHVSELKNGFVKNVEDVVKVGDFVRAKVISAEDGKIRLSIKQLTG